MVYSDVLNEAKATQLSALYDAGLFEKHNSFSLIDFDALATAVTSLRNAFPDHFMHSFAVKANYFLPVLSELRLLGMGAEVAGPGELELAFKAGFDSKKIVFDAPVKTRAELARSLQLGVTINIDNFQEFERIHHLRTAHPGGSLIGFRINPQIGAGSIKLSSTATLTSKFGVGLQDPGNRRRLTELYLANPWLNAIHVHVGSMGCPLELMAEGVRVVAELADEINRLAGGKRIGTIDMGGGLPVDFSSDQNTPAFTDYAEVLRASAPQLFTGEYHVITEFGRAVIAKCAFTLARVEYTKIMSDRHIALTHAGAHNMMRIVFQPGDWARRVTALTCDGSRKTGRLVFQDVAGPCCFAGDIIAHQRELPLLDPGDFVMVHDTGAYCFSNHFNYNALAPCPVYASKLSVADRVDISVVNTGLSVESLVDCFS